MAENLASFVCLFVFLSFILGVNFLADLVVCFSAASDCSGWMEEEEEVAVGKKCTAIASHKFHLTFSF